MKRSQSLLVRFLTWSAKNAGHPLTFVFALVVVVLWLIVWVFSGYNTTVLLMLNTVGTLNAALMVFIIQNTQNWESRALHWPCCINAL